ncbi:MAG: prephenate dehydrogenase/arogenate dehydrogenase family protein [Cytophagales bacterium]
MQTLSIIGFGTFGQFIAPHLTSHFDVYAWNRTDYEEKARELNVNWCQLHRALQMDIIILCTNISFFESFLIENSHFFNPKALVIDVASVKLKPLALMKRYLPSTCEIVGAHPLFGPQSGKNGIEGLNFVLCSERTTKLDCIKKFASEVLKLNVILRTPEEHDQEMAYVQGLTHFIARALSGIQVKEFEMKTRAYERLLDVKNYLGGDSWDLFTSIENDNPFAKEVRIKFQNELNNLERQLDVQHS